MRVLLFVGDADPPEIEYIEETMGLGDAHSLGFIGYITLTESLGLGDQLIPITEVFVTETLGLGDVFAELVSVNETMGLGDVAFQYDIVNVFESLGLGDAQSHIMDIYIEIDETIGLGDGGHGYFEIDYNLRWRTRTKKLNYGYGTAPYGDVESYGDGDVIDELKEFKVKVIRLSDDSVRRTATITIANKQFPDGSAQYSYTSAMNISDNTTFEPNLRFEVYQVDINDNWSPAKYIDITASTEGGDLE